MWRPSRHSHSRLCRGGVPEGREHVLGALRIRRRGARHRRRAGGPGAGGRLGVFILGNLDHAEFRHALLWKVIDLWTGAPPRDWNAECLKLYGDLKAKAKQEEAAREAKRAGELVLSIGTSPLNAGRLEHWNYDTFRVRLGDGRGGWTYVGFNTGMDGAVASLALDTPSMTFARERPAAR